MENLNIKINGDSLENECKSNSQNDPEIIDQESTINAVKNAIINFNEGKETEPKEKCHEKEEGTINMNIVNYLLQIQQIINDDEKRLESYCLSNSFSNEEIEPSSKIEFSQNMSISEFEISMDFLKQTIRKKFNKNFDNLRDLDTKIIKLTAENESLHQTIKSGSKKSKSSFNSDEKLNFKSLNNCSSKKHEIQLKQLNEEIAILEKDNADLGQESRHMKKELRKSKSKIIELTEDLCDANENIKILTEERKILKKKVKEFGNKNPSISEDQLSEFQEKLENIQLQLSDKDLENKTLIKELECLKEENKQLENYAKDIKILESDKEDFESKLKQKDNALQTMKTKINIGLERIALLEEENKKLNIRCENVESECTKKQTALSAMRNKLQTTRVTEEDIEKLQKMPRELASKESDIQKLNQELNELKQNLDEKSRSVEELKNQNVNLSEEINNMKLLNFKSKNK